MIRFASNETTILDDDNLVEMIRLADKYNFVELLKECEKRMSEMINKNNMMRFANVSKKYKLENRFTIEQFVQKNITNRAGEGRNTMNEASKNRNVQQVQNNSSGGKRDGDCYK